MGFVKFKIDKKDVTDGLRSVIDVLPDAASYMIQNLLNIYMTIAQVVAPRLTGALAESHVYEMLSPMDGIMYPTVPYAPYVINPTAPHSIGSSVYIIGVGWRYIGLSPNGKGKIHPGTKGQDYMEDVFNAGEGNIDTEVDNFYEKVEAAWS